MKLVWKTRPYRCFRVASKIKQLYFVSSHNNDLPLAVLFCQIKIHHASALITAIPFNTKWRRKPPRNARNLLLPRSEKWAFGFRLKPSFHMIVENIRSLQSSRSPKIDFHIIAGIVQIVGHIRLLQSSRSLRSLRWWFPLSLVSI